MYPLLDAKKAAIRSCVLELLDKPDMDKEAIARLKVRVSESFGLDRVVKNADLLEALPAEAPVFLRETLRTRMVRALSGVSVIAIMTKPSWCPHGTCVYCPGGPVTNSPKSYTGFEPAARRAAQNDFDSHRQVQARLRQLHAIGHSPQKCEVIIMGGTFNAQPLDYQDFFVKGMYDAFNGTESATVMDAKEENQTAKYRVIGLTVETKPDWATPKHLDPILDYGCTRIELGIQSLDEEVLRKTHRGHDLQASVDATAYSKDAFLKVCYHMMPGLFSTPEKDIGYFRELFANPAWRPDMLKIYPCLVVPNTGLYEMWKRGEFVPYNADQAAEVLSEAKRFIQPYCRVMRIDRDIPTNVIAAGVEKSNLRELVKAKMDAKGVFCRCIRCREAGLAKRFGKTFDWNDLELKRIDYEASGGKEIFLSFEANGLLLGFLRLRLPGSPWRPEITPDTAGVRELHVYGEQLTLHSKKDAVQHKSLGKSLMAEAERIVRDEWGCKKLLVISGVGVREYYQKLGFTRDGVYMGKKI